MAPISVRRTAASAAPIAIMVAVIGLLAVAQFRWLSELGTASRLRLERDLRAAVQTAAAELSLATARLEAGIESAATAADRAAAWNAWRRAMPDLAGLYHPDSARLKADRDFVVDSLLPILSRRVAAVAVLRAGLTLVRRGAEGTEEVVARLGIVGTAPPDAEGSLELIGWSQTAIFRPHDLTSTPASPRPLDSFSWEARRDSSVVEVALNSPIWSLRAWYEPGSLERSVARIRRRNLFLGSALILVLVGSAALILRALRRNERLAADRAMVLGGVCHEVRTPIAVIRSAADNLATGVIEAPEQIREYGALIDREVNRLERDVEAALAFAVAGDPADADGDPAELLDLLHAVRDASETPSRIVIESSGALEARINRRTMAIAIRNLVANALAYSPTDQPVIVQLGRHRDHAQVTVLDRGPGIASADRPRVFEPFVRGSAGSASGRPGLGLGLALARRIVMMHGGTIVALDREGGGAALRLRLPFR